MRLWRSLAWIGLGLLAVLAGWWWFAGRSTQPQRWEDDDSQDSSGLGHIPAGVAMTKYGSPQPGGYPHLTIKDFSYTPASPLHSGDKLRLSARASRPSRCWIAVAYGDNPPAEQYIVLYDLGVAPDAKAGDGVYDAEVDTASLPHAQGRLNLRVYLYEPSSGDIIAEIDGPPLTVLPEDGK